MYCLLEAIAESDQHLVTLVAHLHTISYTVVGRRGAIGHVAHEGIEITISLTVLVCQIHKELLHLVAKPCRYAVGRLPVGVIG